MHYQSDRQSHREDGNNYKDSASASASERIHTTTTSPRMLKRRVAAMILNVPFYLMVWILKHAKLGLQAIIRLFHSE